MTIEFIQDKLKEQFNTLENNIVNLIKENKNDLLIKKLLVSNKNFIDENKLQEIKNIIVDSFSNVLSLLIANEKLFVVKINNKPFYGRVIPILKTNDKIEYISVLRLYQELQKAIELGKLNLNLIREKHKNGFIYVCYLPIQFSNYLKYFDKDSLQVINLNKDKGVNKIVFVKGNYILSQILNRVNTDIKRNLK